MKKISKNKYYTIFDYAEPDKYIVMPRFLFCKKYIKTSSAAKLLYCHIRGKIYIDNDYLIDNNGDKFLHLAVSDIEEIINCGKGKAIKVKKELIKYDLIKDVKVGLGSLNKVYIVNYLDC